MVLKTGSSLESDNMGRSILRVSMILVEYLRFSQNDLYFLTSFPSAIALTP